MTSVVFGRCLWLFGQANAVAAVFRIVRESYFSQVVMIFHKQACRFAKQAVQIPVNQLHDISIVLESGGCCESDPIVRQASIILGL